MSPAKGPAEIRVIPALLVAVSILWGNAVRLCPGSGDGFILCVVLLPILAGTLVFLYPWSQDPPASQSRLRRILLWTLLTASALWLTISTLSLGFFYLIALTTGWD